jgi:Zn-dependent M28 family amino/carboxypeptidase
VLRFRFLRALALAASLAAYTADITPARKAALDRISAQSLQGHVSFLASDLLEGRDTPSRGLDVAAEYIAAQFRRAGLKPAGDNGYFQTARFILAEQPQQGVELEFQAKDIDLRPAKEDLRVASGGKADFSDVTPVKILPGDAISEAVEGKVVIVPIERQDAFTRTLAALTKLKPSAVVFVQAPSARPPQASPRLVDSELRQTAPFPVIRAYNRDLFKLANAAKPGVMDARLSLRSQPIEERQVELRNVAGILPGSDPALAEAYVLVTAHYDHVGMKTPGGGDLIYNGANDDASGVASVIEIASALSALRPGPRRGVLFMAYFGEEKGLLGSRYYARHPLVPLSKTVADLNLEQLGRSDGDGRPGAATMTGFGYSDITTALEMAGAATGVKIYNQEKNGDAFFARSDNQSLADQGIPAHTLAAAFDFPDYHKPGDEWEKLDYPNMEKVDRAIALSVMMIADSTAPPRWNEANEKTGKYVKAQRELK